MRRYHFHCVGGGTAVFDHTGRWVETVAEVVRTADAVARALMARSFVRDWSGWQIDIYDTRGRCLLIRPFPEPESQTGNEAA